MATSVVVVSGPSVKSEWEGELGRSARAVGLDARQVSKRFGRVGDCADRPQRAATAWAELGVDVVDAGDQLGPRRSEVLAFGTRIHDGKGELNLRWRPRNDVAPVFRSGCEDPGITKLMLPRR